MDHYKKVKKAGDVLDTYLRHEGIDLERNSSFFNAWNSIAGERIASQSKIKDVVRGTLIVEVLHPACRHLISLSCDILLRKISRMYPELEIKGIRVFLAETGGKKTGNSSAKIDEHTKKREISRREPSSTEQNEDALQKALKKLKESVYQTSVIDKDKT